MAQNHEGGYSFVLDDFKRLDRFLIMGADSSTFYQTQAALTVENAQCVVRCLEKDGIRTVARIAEVSDQGLAFRNSAAIFSLALAAKLGNTDTKTAAYRALPLVCRIPTHLYEFVAAVEHFGGWGSGTKRAVARWLMSKTPKQLLFHGTKYKQRNGWSMRDLFRL
ncbi:MAG: TROVE domain-containing protein, partial [Planctomycetes bacterium]|nr:TROVE domain-containing protein [Planctomycetota bacterium]